MSDISNFLPVMGENCGKAGNIDIRSDQLIIKNGKFISNSTKGGGNKEFVCARCSRIREIGVGHISKLKGNYGFIKNNKRDFFFHFQNADPYLHPFEGKHVKFEVEFSDNKIEAINVKDIFNKIREVFHEH